MQQEERRYIDFFPLTPGMEWLYRIDATRPVSVMRYWEQWWPFDRAFQDWRRIDRPARVSPTKELREILLQLKVKALVTPESLPSYLSVCKSAPETIAELQVIRDDLKVFGEVRRFFWVRCDASYQGQPLPVINEVILYGVGSFPAQAFPELPHPQADGYTLRPVFLGAGPGLTFSETRHGLKSQQRLTFLGPVNHGGPSLFDLAFRRTVTVQEEPEIVEETVFSWRRGLTALRQEVGGKISMQWRLIRLSGE